MKSSDLRSTKFKNSHQNTKNPSRSKKLASSNHLEPVPDQKKTKSRYKSSRRQNPIAHTSVALKNVKKLNKSINPSEKRRKTVNNLKFTANKSRMSKEPNLNQLDHSTEKSNSILFHMDSTNNLKNSGLTKEPTLDMIEDKWEALLKDFDLHHTAADGRIQSGKVYTQQNKIEKHLNKNKSKNKQDDKQELSFAFGESRRGKERSSANDFLSFNLGSFKNRKLGDKLASKEDRKEFNLEEEMSKINQSYNILGASKKEILRESRISGYKSQDKNKEKTSISGLYTGNNLKRKQFSNQPKDEKTKAIENKYKKLYTTKKGKTLLILLKLTYFRLQIFRHREKQATLLELFKRKYQRVNTSSPNQEEIYHW